ncbi:sugar ABC transporter substrate-binding protein [Evansella halocellulosilytica]|uniref:sugar ABC transporter substrate-binding protein n=1 Tax=Evansella halocellulosilytica TaxID=2011013 RepID=UPI000BB6D66A|nr:sugar ABC transporter substrate-binding protein [Evansella halocellulosilytica]
MMSEKIFKNGFMSLLLILFLAACSDDGGSEPADTDGDTDTDEVDSEEETDDGVEADADASGSDEQAELRVWIMETGSPEEAEEYFARVNERFNEQYPNVEVNVQFIPWLSAHQNLITAIAGGGAPDIAELGTTWNPEFAAMGALANMDDVVQEWGMTDGWVPALEEVGTYDDSLYGIPWYAGVRQLIYNEDIFDEAGVDVPTNFDELWEVSEAIVNNTDAYAYPAVGISQHFILPKIWHFGGELAVQEEDEDGEMRWVSTVNEPEAVEAMEFYTNMYKEGFVPEGALNWSVLETRQAFAQEDLAMTIDLPAGVNAMISENPDIEDKVGVAPLPGNESNSSFVGGSNLAVFEQSQNKELANEYLELLVSDEFITEWAEFTGFFPGTLEGLENPIFTDDEMLSIFSDAMIDGRSYPASPSWGRFEGENLFVAPVQEVMQGQKTAEEAMEDMAESMNNAFQTE